MQIDWETLVGALGGAAFILSWLARQITAKERAQRRRLREVIRRELDLISWIGQVLRLAAARGWVLPPVPRSSAHLFGGDDPDGDDPADVDSGAGGDP